ncbi:MAG: GAF domain-containing protein, partial [Alphaproteobacteria bacterium]
MHTHVTPTTLTEAHRLSVLRGLNILDTAPDPEFDDLVDLAAHFFAAKYALVSLVDEDRQFYKARHAFAAKQSPREGAFCAHAIMQDDVFVVPNTTQDERFHDKASVTGPPHI